MFLKYLSLQNFRNYKKAEFKFSDNTTLIVGPNTSGKSNFIEAISFLSFGKSFRVENDEQAIQFQANLASVKGKTDSLDLQVMIAKIPRSLKKYLVNGVSKRRLDFVGNLPSVSFSPLDLDILIGSPGKRREFLDAVLTQTDRDYRLAEALYQKGLRQRNRLLHKARETGVRNEKEFEYWDDLLINTGVSITEKREDFINFLNTEKKDILDFKIFYDKSVISIARLLQYKEAELASAVTLVGPHRDDFWVELSGHDAKFFASRGQQRLVVLQLKFLEMLFVKKKLGESPLFLLDDIFSELDQDHINLVLDMVGSQQTFITTTHKELVPKKVIKMSIIELNLQ